MVIFLKISDINKLNFLGLRRLIQRTNLETPPYDRNTISRKDLLNKILRTIHPFDKLSPLLHPNLI
jgi:hypothetical protein